MTHQQKIEVLRNAKERLFEKGWTKGRLGGVDGPNCMVGAIIQSWNCSYSVAVYAAVAEVIDGGPQLIPVCQIEHFNDNINTTFNDVVDAFDQAIKNLEMKISES